MPRGRKKKYTSDYTKSEAARLLNNSRKYALKKMGLKKAPKKGSVNISEYNSHRSYYINNKAKAEKRKYNKGSGKYTKAARAAQRKRGEEKRAKAGERKLLRMRI